MKDLSIPLRLCVFAKKKKKRVAPRNSAGQATKPQRIGNYSFCLSAAGKRSGVYFNSISIVFPIYFTQPAYRRQAQRSLFLFYFHCISSSVLCTNEITLSPELTFFSTFRNVKSFLTFVCSRHTLFVCVFCKLAYPIFMG